MSRALIIGAALVLAGCSALRLVYNQGPSLARWWVDRYVDLTDAQKEPLQEALGAWFAWNRRQQLPEIAQLLAQARREVADPVTAERVCQWNEVVRNRIDQAVDRAIPLVAPLLGRLEPAQVEHLQSRFDKSNAQFRKDYLKTRPDDRLELLVDRAVDRAETLYGRLDGEQKRLLAEGLRPTLPDAELRYEARLAFQREVLRVLQGVMASRGDGAAAQVALRQFQKRWSDTYRANPALAAQRTMLVSCEVAARLHNTTTAAQRRNAQERLLGWEEDLRALVAQAPPRP